MALKFIILLPPYRLSLDYTNYKIYPFLVPNKILSYYLTSLLDLPTIYEIKERDWMEQLRSSRSPLLSLIFLDPYSTGYILSIFYLKRSSNF